MAETYIKGSRYMSLQDFLLDPDDDRTMPLDMKVARMLAVQARLVALLVRKGVISPTELEGLADYVRHDGDRYPDPIELTDVFDESA